MAGTAARASLLTAVTCAPIRSDTTCGSTPENSRYPANPTLLTSKSGPAAAITLSSPARSPGSVRSTASEASPPRPARQINLFCAPQLMSTEDPAAAPNGGSARVIRSLTVTH